jgi:hypothetical protein
VHWAGKVEVEPHVHLCTSIYDRVGEEVGPRTEAERARIDVTASKDIRWFSREECRVMFGTGGEATTLFAPFLDERDNPQRTSIRRLGIRVEQLERFGLHAQALLIAYL